MSVRNSFFDQNFIFFVFNLNLLLQYFLMPPIHLGTPFPSFPMFFIIFFPRFYRNELPLRETRKSRLKLYENLHKFDLFFVLFFFSSPEGFAAMKEISLLLVLVSLLIVVECYSTNPILDILDKLKSSKLPQHNLPGIYFYIFKFYFPFSFFLSFLSFFLLWWNVPLTPF